MDVLYAREVVPAGVDLDDYDEWSFEVAVKLGSLELQDLISALMRAAKAETEDYSDLETLVRFVDEFRKARTAGRRAKDMAVGDRKAYCAGLKPVEEA